MSKNRDKIVESLPENLLYNPDSGEICSNQMLCSNTTWGPFDVDKSPIDLNSSITLIWSHIICVEWVDFLIKNTIKKLASSKIHNDYNVKIIFSGKNLQILVSTTKDLDVNEEIKCDLIAINHIPIKAQFASDLSNKSDQNIAEKISTACKYCGISFYNQFTLEAHMTYYCSMRPKMSTNLNVDLEFAQKWYNLLQNKPYFALKSENNISDNLRMLNDEDLRNETFVKLKRLSNRSDNSQIKKIYRKSILQPIMLANGNNQTNSNLSKISCFISGNENSEVESDTSDNLIFCEPCRLFFTSKDLYNIHMQQDSTNLKKIPIHCHTLILNSLNNNNFMPQNYKSETHEDVIPLDLSMNGSSKSPITPSNDVIQIDSINRTSTVLDISNCSQLVKFDKRPFLCLRCQTRFKLYSTFQAHQEFYCQGKHPQSDISVPLKKFRSLNNNHDFGQIEFEMNTLKNDENWNICNQGFKCNSCGFIGKTRRGIKIHCKNPCLKSKIINLKSDGKHEEFGKFSHHLSYGHHDIPLNKKLS